MKKKEEEEREEASRSVYFSWQRERERERERDKAVSPSPNGSRAEAACNFAATLPRGSILGKNSHGERKTFSRRLTRGNESVNIFTRNSPRNVSIFTRGFPSSR